MASPWYESDIESYQEGAFIMAIQKETFDAVYDFLESEANDEV